MWRSIWSSGNARATSAAALMSARRSSVIGELSEYSIGEESWRAGSDPAGDLVSRFPPPPPLLPRLPPDLLRPLLPEPPPPPLRLMPCRPCVEVLAIRSLNSRSCSPFIWARTSSVYTESPSRIAAPLDPRLDPSNDLRTLSSARDVDCLSAAEASEFGSLKLRMRALSACSCENCCSRISRPRSSLASALSRRALSRSSESSRLASLSASSHCDWNWCLAASYLLRSSAAPRTEPSLTLCGLRPAEALR